MVVPQPPKLVQTNKRQASKTSQSNKNVQGTTTSSQKSKVVQGSQNNDVNIPISKSYTTSEVDKLKQLGYDVSQMSDGTIVYSSPEIEYDSYNNPATKERTKGLYSAHKVYVKNGEIVKEENFKPVLVDAFQTSRGKTTFQVAFREAKVYQDKVYDWNSQEVTTNNYNIKSQTTQARQQLSEMEHKGDVTPAEKIQYQKDKKEYDKIMQDYRDSKFERGQAEIAYNQAWKNYNEQQRLRNLGETNALGYKDLRNEQSVIYQPEIQGDEKYEGKSNFRPEEYYRIQSTDNSSQSRTSDSLGNRGVIFNKPRSVSQINATPPEVVGQQESFRTAREALPGTYPQVQNIAAHGLNVIKTLGSPLIAGYETIKADSDLDKIANWEEYVDDKGRKRVRPVMVEEALLKGLTPLKMYNEPYVAEGAITTGLAPVGAWAWKYPLVRLGAKGYGGWMGYDTVKRYPGDYGGYLEGGVYALLPWLGSSPKGGDYDKSGKLKGWMSRLRLDGVNPNRYELSPADTSVDKFRKKEFEDLSRLVRIISKNKFELKDKLALEKVKGMNDKLANNVRLFLSKQKRGFMGGSTIHESVKGVELARKPQDIEWYTDDTRFRNKLIKFFTEKGFSVKKEGHALYVDGVKFDVNPILTGQRNIKTVTVGNWQDYVMKSKDGINVVDPRVLLRRSLVGAFERGGDSKKPLARYSKDIPRLFALAEQRIKQLENENNPGLLKIWKNYRNNLAKLLYERYAPPKKVERLQPIKFRGFEERFDYPKALSKRDAEIIAEINKRGGYLGGSSGLYFQIPGFRKYGDIDAYFSKNPEKALSFAQSMSKKYNLDMEKKSHILLKEKGIQVPIIQNKKVKIPIETELKFDDTVASYNPYEDRITLNKAYLGFGNERKKLIDEALKHELTHAKDKLISADTKFMNHILNDKNAFSFKSFMTLYKDVIPQYVNPRRYYELTKIRFKDPEKYRLIVENYRVKDWLTEPRAYMAENSKNPLKYKVTKKDILDYPKEIEFERGKELAWKNLNSNREVLDITSRNQVEKIREVGGVRVRDWKLILKDKEGIVNAIETKKKLGKEISQIEINKYKKALADIKLIKNSPMEFSKKYELKNKWADLKALKEALKLNKKGQYRSNYNLKADKNRIYYPRIYPSLNIQTPLYNSLYNTPKSNKYNTPYIAKFDTPYSTLYNAPYNTPYNIPVSPPYSPPYNPPYISPPYSPPYTPPIENPPYIPITENLPTKNPPYIPKIPRDDFDKVSAFVPLIKDNNGKIVNIGRAFQSRKMADSEGMELTDNTPGTRYEVIKKTVNINELRSRSLYEAKYKFSKRPGTNTRIERTQYRNDKPRENNYNKNNNILSAFKTAYAA